MLADPRALGIRVRALHLLSWPFPLLPLCSLLLSPRHSDIHNNSCQSCVRHVRAVGVIYCEMVFTPTLTNGCRDPQLKMGKQAAR